MMRGNTQLQQWNATYAASLAAADAAFSFTLSPVAMAYLTFQYIALAVRNVRAPGVVQDLSVAL
jgi:hypothetical protein